MTTAKNDWYVANVEDNDSVRRFTIIDMDNEYVCSGIAKFDGCMDFSVHIGHFCCDEKINAFADIVCQVRSIATVQQQ